jgi:hypothetical protein
MAIWITEHGQIEKLNDFVVGKSINNVECDGDDITLNFTDGSSASLSTLGGIEISRLTRQRKVNRLALASPS